MKQLHFCYLSKKYSSKNALQKELIAYFQSIDRMLIEDLEAFKKAVVYDVSIYCRKFSKCSAIKASWPAQKNKDLILRLDAVNQPNLTLLDFKILEVKQ